MRPFPFVFGHPYNSVLYGFGYDSVHDEYITSCHFLMIKILGLGCKIKMSLIMRMMMSSVSLIVLGYLLISSP